MKNVKSITTYYSGSNLEEYIIHQIESVVKVMSAPAERIKADNDGETIKYEIVFRDGRSAVMEFNINNGYRSKIEYLDGSVTDILLCAIFLKNILSKG